MPSYEKVSQAEPFSDAQKQSPWRSLLSVYAAQMSGALALGIAQPFIPALCKRWEIDEDYIGIASGLLVGIFPLATFLSNTPLGHLSDIYGRKKLLLLGLATGAIGTAAFGVVQNFWLALLVRFVAGLTNSTMALSKAVVADLTTGKQRTLAFAYLGSTLSLARTISGTIGGLTAGIVIADNVPVLDNPYMLPLLIGSCINTVSFFAAVVFVPETRSKGGKKREGGSMLQGIREIAGDRLMRRLVTVFCLNSFGNSGILLVFALYFALEVEYHGLGFTPFQIGLYLTAFGGVAFLFQMLIFKRLLSRWSVVRIYEVGTILLGVGTTITPVSGFFYWFGEVRRQLVGGNEASAVRRTDRHAAAWDSL